MKADSRMVRTTVYLPADLRERLHELAAQRRVSTATVIRGALEAAAIVHRPDPVGGFLRESPE